MTEEPSVKAYIADFFFSSVILQGGKNEVHLVQKRNHDLTAQAWVKRISGC